MCASTVQVEVETGETTSLTPFILGSQPMIGIELSFLGLKSLHFGFKRGFSHIDQV